MKRCAVCGKIYGYESLRFCRFDGSRLLDITSCEAPTILLNPEELPDNTGGLLVENVNSEHQIHPFS